MTTTYYRWTERLY